MKNLIIILDFTNQGYLPAGVFDSVDTFIEQKIKELEDKYKDSEYTLLKETIKVVKYGENEIVIFFFLKEFPERELRLSFYYWNNLELNTLIPS